MILQVIVRKTKMVVRASDHIPYVRRGAQNLPVNTPESLALLQRNKGITSFENEPVNVDLKAICNSETVIKFILEVVPTSEPEPWLRKQELIKEEKPTVAGIRSENSMKGVFLRLRDHDEIEQVPERSGFASAWRKKHQESHKKKEG